MYGEESFEALVELLTEREKRKRQLSLKIQRLRSKRQAIEKVNFLLKKLHYNFLFAETLLFFKATKQIQDEHTLLTNCVADLHKRKIEAEHQRNDQERSFQLNQ